MPTTVVVSSTVSVTERKWNGHLPSSAFYIFDKIIIIINSYFVSATLQVLLTILELLLTLVLYWLVVSVNCLWCSGWSSDCI